MNKKLVLAQNLIDYIYDSPTAYHAVAKAKEELCKDGFVEIKEEEKWDLKKGGKYFVTKNDSALTAFIVGKGKIEESGFKIIGAHTDSPSFRIKPKPEMLVDNIYVKLNTEVYGGPIINTWMDRPLAIAGRVTLRSENILYPETRLVNIKRPIMIIPNVAIHMNREVNSGVELNKQKDTLPLLSMVNGEFEKNNYLLSVIAKELCVDLKQIIDFD